MPGGKIEFGESIKDCIKRELEEEADTTLEVEFERLLFANEFLSEDGRHKIELIALVEIDKFQEINKVKDPQHDGRSILEWVSLDQLPDNIIPKEMGDEIKRSAKNRFKDAEFILFSSFL